MGFKVTLRKNGKQVGQTHYTSEAVAVGMAEKMNAAGGVQATVEKCNGACGAKANPKTVSMADVKAAVLAGADGGYLTDVARAPALRGVHFSRIQAAAEALAKAGKVSFDGVTIGPKANPHRRNSSSYLDTPFHDVLEEHGWAYSHSTPIGHPGGRTTTRHTYVHPSYEGWTKYPRIGVDSSAWSGGMSGSARMVTGRTVAELAKYLKGALARGKKKNPRRNGTTAARMAASRSMAHAFGLSRNKEKIEAYVPSYLSLPRHGGTVILAQHPKSKIPSVVAIGGKPTKLHKEMYAGCTLSVVPASTIKARPVGMNNPRRKNPSMSADLAGILVKQLGGMGKLVAMVGAKDFVRGERDGSPSLSFKFKGSTKANYVTIVLDPSDTYSLYFGKIVKYDLKPTGSFSGVYAEMLKPTFERFTGLYLSL